MEGIYNNQSSCKLGSAKPQKAIPTTLLPIPLHDPLVSYDRFGFSALPNPCSSTLPLQNLCHAGRHCLTCPPLSWLPLFQPGSCRLSLHTLQSLRIKEYPSLQTELLIVTHLSNCKFQALHSQSSPSLNVSSHHYNPLSLLKARYFNLAILKTILAGTSKEKEPIRNKQFEVRVLPCSAHRIKR